MNAKKAPSQTKQPVVTYLPPELLERIESEAKKSLTTPSAIIRQTLAQHFNWQPGRVDEERHNAADLD